MQPERPRAKTFRDLLVWRKAHEFVLGVYQFTATFPKHETYGLALQMRRAAVSIPANIAEGFSRRGDADKVRFFNIAAGSLEESRYYLILGHDLGYGDTETLMDSLGGSEPATERLHESHSGSWLLTPGSYIPLQRDIKGRSPLPS
jgi:four helix bundle protein